MIYKPSPIPTSFPPGVQTWLAAELNRIAAALAGVDNLSLSEQGAEPDKYEDGDFAYADGTSWDPGDGEGVYMREGGAWVKAGGGGGASQLSDLSDVNTSTATNRNVLVADGVDFESRALVEADISDLGSYTDATASENISGDWEFDVDTSDFLQLKLSETYASPPVVINPTDNQGIKFVDAAGVEIFQIGQQGNGGFSFRTSIRGQNFSFSGKNASTGATQTCAIMANTLNTGFSAYNNGVQRFGTTTVGVRVNGTYSTNPSTGGINTGNYRLYPSTGATPFMEIGNNGSADSRWMNYTYGGDLYHMLKGSGGSWQYPLRCYADGEVELRHNDTKKFETSVDGITVSGSIYLEENAAGSDVSGAGQLVVKDNAGTQELWFRDDAGTETQLA